MICEKCGMDYVPSWGSCPYCGFNNFHTKRTGDDMWADEMGLKQSNYLLKHPDHDPDLIYPLTASDVMANYVIMRKKADESGKRTSDFELFDDDDDDKQDILSDPFFTGLPTHDGARKSTRQDDDLFGEKDSKKSSSILDDILGGSDDDDLF